MVDNRIFDFGVVDINDFDSIGFYFNLKNLGPKNVIIHDVEATCPCVRISVKPDTISPGEYSLIGGKIGIKDSRGLQNKAIFVNYDDDKIMLLRIKGNLK